MAGGNGGKRFWQLVALLTALSLCGGIGWLAAEWWGDRGGEREALQRFLDAGRIAFALADADSARTPPGQTSPNPAALSWFANLAERSTGFAIATEPLGDTGFQPVAIRLLPVDGRTAAHISYVHEDGRRAALMAIRDPDRRMAEALPDDTYDASAELYRHRNNEAKAVYWREGDTVHAFASIITADTLAALATQLRSQSGGDNR